jgi:hypothetical protein
MSRRVGQCLYLDPADVEAVAASMPALGPEALSSGADGSWWEWGNLGRSTPFHLVRGSPHIRAECAGRRSGWRGAAMARMVQGDSTVDLQPAKRRTFVSVPARRSPCAGRSAIQLRDRLDSILARGEMSMTRTMASGANDVPHLAQHDIERWRTPAATSLVGDAGSAVAMVVWRLLKWADRRANGQIRRGRLGRGDR